MAIVRIGDQVTITLQYGSSVGLSNNSARAVVADALSQYGLQLVSYDNQSGFFGGPATLVVSPTTSDYGDKQDIANLVAGILSGSLGLPVSNAIATRQASGFSIDAGPGSYEQVPYNAGVVGTVTVRTQDPDGTIYTGERGPNGGEILIAPDGTRYESFRPGWNDEIASLLSPVSRVGTPVINTASDVANAAGRIGSDALSALSSFSNWAGDSSSPGMLAVLAVVCLVLVVVLSSGKGRR